MLSATGNILPGSVDRPSMATLVPGRHSDVDTQVCTWNNLGYIPVISTITGCARASLGIIHSIIHLALAIFNSKNRDHHLQEAKLGGSNICRGPTKAVASDRTPGLK